MAEVSPGPNEGRPLEAAFFVFGRSGRQVPVPFKAGPCAPALPDALSHPSENTAMRWMLSLVLISMVLTPVAIAAPPYDVDVTVTAPADGGPVDTYILMLDGEEIGSVQPAVNSFPGLITSDGTHEFRVDTTNAAGTTIGDSVVVQIQALQLPGKATISIQVHCDPCIVTEQ